MKIKNILIFLLLSLVIAFSGFVLVNGFSAGNVNIAPIKDNLKQGLDLKGGVYVVYEAQTDKKGEELNKVMEQTLEVFTKRINGMGLTEPLIVREGQNRIRIELPGLKDAAEALKAIGKTAQLKFEKEDGTVVVTGSNVTKSDVVFDSQTNEPVVAIGFDSEGTKAFSDATKELSPTRGRIVIKLDGEIISAPSVNTHIANGNATISGGFDVEGASELANLIRAGALPVDFKEVQTSTITATLGVDALNKSIEGAKVGIGLVLLFMIIYYKIPGFVAGIALSAYTMIILATFAGLHITITLPGIAALILSVGMAVDANVIIFERIKEELKNGKTIRSSIESGFSKALSTIIDSNITTFISGLVLYNFGTGTIKGFAITLMVGIIASLFTAVFVTKILLRSLAHSNIIKSKKLFGM